MIQSIKMLKHIERVCSQMLYKSRRNQSKVCLPFVRVFAGEGMYYIKLGYIVSKTNMQRSILLNL